MEKEYENNDLPTDDTTGEIVGREMPTYRSERLFGSSTEISIVHEGALYRLKITRNGRLILNK